MITMSGGNEVDCAYILKLLTTLEDPFSGYYSDGYLNSEGMTILSLIAKSALRQWPWMTQLFRKVRVRRDYHSVINLARVIRDQCGH